VNRLTSFTIMKIAYLSGSRIPSNLAHSIHVMKMCSAFAGLGHEVTLFGIKNGQNRESIPAFYNIQHPFNIHLVKPNRLPGQRVYIALSYLIRLFQGSFDLIYSRNLFAAYFVTRLYRKPLIFELHTLPTPGLQKRLMEGIVRYRNLRQLVVISESLKNDLLESINSRGIKIVLAHDGADYNGSVPVPIGSDSMEFNVGYIGNLYPGKGVELIYAMARECDDSSVKFHIVGGDPNLIKYWLSELGDQDNIVFHGAKSPRDADALRKSFDVLVAPYTKTVHSSGGRDISKWMSPLKIFEYMAARKPILASDLPVLHEVLVHMENCILCKPENAVDWADAIKLLKEDKTLGDKLSDRAYNDFISRYTWDRRAEQVLISAF